MIIVPITVQILISKMHITLTFALRNKNSICKIINKVKYIVENDYETSFLLYYYPYVISNIIIILVMISINNMYLFFF